MDADLLLDKPHLLGHYLGYDKLEDIHSEWIKYIWLNTEDCALQAFRGSYKTTSVLIVGTIWYLLFNPDARILIAREEGKNARKILFTIREHYRKPKLMALYQELYNVDMSLTRDTDTSITINLKETDTPEGNLECTGMDWSLTGGHYDRIHTDDVITVKDRISQAKRDTTKRFLLELNNIIDPRGFQSHTGTPWHRGDGWQYLPKPRQYPVGSIELPEFTPEVIAKKKAGTTPSLYAANYLLRHIVDEGGYFSEPNMGVIPLGLSMQGHVDAKYKGTHTMAYTAMGEYEDILYARGYLFHENIEDKYDDIVILHNSHNCGTIHLENNADKGLAATQFANRGLPVNDYNERINKHVKIIQFLYKNFKRIVWDLDTDSEYLEQVINYQEGQEPDDAPDSAASIIKEAYNRDEAQVETEDYGSSDTSYINDDNRGDY